MRAALSALDPPEVAVLLLIVVHEFTAAETDAIVGASAQSVAKRYGRAKRRLRDVYLAQNTPAEQAQKGTEKEARS
jgi:DNA-directed RNA polymerase specialized sigma24 family protein